jgi:two-component system response regulator YesN
MTQKKTAKNNLKFHDVAEIEVLRKILTSFTKATGLKAFVVDTKGETLVTSDKNHEYCEFCNLVRSSDQGLKKCKNSYARAGLEASKYGKPYIFRCHAGLVVWAAPIVIEEEHVGAICCGQVLMWEPEDYFWEEIEEMTKGLPINVEQLIVYAKQLEVLSAERVQGAADLLFIVSNYIMKTGVLTLSQRREISQQQARLSEEIQARKVLEDALKIMEDISVQGNFLEKERELIALVRRGDRRGALKALDELLADILQNYSDSGDFKVRTLELLVILSRAAVEGGAKVKTLLDIKSQYISEFSKLKNIEEICYWISQAIEQFMACIEEGKDVHNLHVVQKAGEYLHTHFREKINIQDVARAVYLSPCHLSKVFKQELGCTIMEFLTKIRIEEAKRMLRDPQYSVIQVANALGFKDPGYFTKVFKRSEGITPSQYREKAI